jgi:hypothetical protein
MEQTELRLNLLTLWEDVREELGMDRRAVAVTPVIFETSGGVRTIGASDVMKATITVLERHGFVGTEEVAEREALMERDERADQGFYNGPEDVVEHNEWEDEGPEPVRAGDVW